MALHEKCAWVSLIAVLAIGIWYFAAALVVAEVVTQGTQVVPYRRTA